MKRLVTMNNKIPILCNLVGQFNEICSNLTLLKYQSLCTEDSIISYLYREFWIMQSKVFIIYGV